MDNYFLKNNTNKVIALIDDLFQYITQEYSDEIEMIDDFLYYKGNKSKTNPLDFLTSKGISYNETNKNPEIKRFKVVKLHIEDGILIGTDYSGKQHKIF